MQQILNIENEKNILIKGATKVVSSTPNQAVIQTETGLIVFTGTEFEVKRLDIDQSEVMLFGNVSNIKFSKKTEKQPLIKRIFK